MTWIEGERRGWGGWRGSAMRGRSDRDAGQREGTRLGKQSN